MRKLDLVILIVSIAGVSLVVHSRGQGRESKMSPSPSASLSSSPAPTVGTDCRANFHSMATALEMYATDHAGRYPSSLGELVPKYLAAIPRCSLADRDTYVDSYVVKARPDYYAFYCKGHWHEQEGLAIDLPRYSSEKGLEPMTKQNLPSCRTSVKNLATALEMYSTDNGGRYPTSLKLLVPNYLKSLPLCKEAGTDTYSHSYVVSQSPDAFTFVCEGENHSSSGGAENFPQYSSLSGFIDK